MKIGAPWPTVAEAEVAKLRVRRLPNHQTARTHPPRIRIVENHDPIVGGEPDIAFDSGARFDCRGERDQAVLRKARAIMQAAVGEPLRSWIERIRT